MNEPDNGLPVLSFESRTSLHQWLEQNYAESGGIWVRIFRKNSGIPSLTF